MNAPPYKFSEFVDLVLVLLYDLDRKDSEGFADLSIVANDLKAEVPASWLIDAAKVLQSLNLAQSLINSKGVFAHISGAGRFYVEEGRGFTRQIEQNRPSYYNIHVTGSGNQIMTGTSTGSTTQSISHSQDSGPWAKLVDSIEPLSHILSVAGQVANLINAFNG